MLRPDLRRRSARLKSNLMKGWGLVIVCAVTSAVKLFVLRDNSTEGFIEGWTRFASDCGEPISV